MKQIGHFISLSRPINVLITALAFGLACSISNNFGSDFLLDPTFWSALGCICLITATGYWINDVYDFKIDRINKPTRTIVNAHLSVKKVLTVYFLFQLSIIGISLFMLGNLFTAINLSAIAILFGYASWLKRISVAGNLLIAGLTGLVVYFAGLIYYINLPLIWTILFAFEITFLREVTKDVEDIPGDVQYKLDTLPIRVGMKGTVLVLNIGYVIFLLSTYLPLVEEYYRLHTWNISYQFASILLVQIPAIYLLILLNRSKTPSDFTFQSKLLKWVILGGMISVLFLV